MCICIFYEVSTLVRIFFKSVSNPSPYSLLYHDLPPPTPFNLPYSIILSSSVILLYYMSPLLKAYPQWSLTSFLISMCIPNESYITKDSKLTSTYNRKRTTFVFLSLCYLTYNNSSFIHLPVYSIISSLIGD